MTTTVSGITVSQSAYTYNTQDLRDGETTLDPTPAYADYLANYTYNNVNELTQIADPGSKNLTYDASGNLTGSYTPAGYALTATYDGSNRLLTSTYTDGGGVVNKTEYYYLGNTLHRRKNYRNGTLITENRYLYDGSLAVQERDKNNNLVNEYTYGLGLPGGIGGLLRLNQSGAAYSYLYDGKGNVTALLNGSTGQVAQTYLYDPFGVPKGGTGSIIQPVRFSTKPYDDQTGLSYYGYRFYTPSLGRWMTRDPIGELGGKNLYGFVDSVGKPFSGTNLYTFTANNPVNVIDPYGLINWWKVGGGSIVLANGAVQYGFGSYIVGLGILEMGTMAEGNIFAIPLGAHLMGLGGSLMGTGVATCKIGKDLFIEGWNENDPTNPNPITPQPYVPLDFSYAT